MTSRFTRALQGAALALCLTTAGLAQAANSYFLQVGGLTGDSTDKDHKGWIAIDSFSWGLTLATTGGSTAVGKATFQDFAWTQAVDSSTPKWFLDVATGKHIPQVTLDVVKTGGKSSASFFQMIFTETLGTGLKLGGDADSITANASMSSGATVKLRYRAQDSKGAFGPWAEGAFDIKGNKATALFSGDETVLLGLFGAGGTIAFDSRAVTAVPEPASAALLFGGLAVLVLRRRRG
ncbi:MAG: type VI secretion system tube protein Hcp [Burkholderiales bacterium]|jgi:type VI protein secretion system component Hcp|nr:type VI secretion system tube protein Hcp [Burkholderiales bacterium]